MYKYDIIKQLQHPNRCSYIEMNYVKNEWKDKYLILF